MQFERFVTRHPGCSIGRPPWLRWATGAAAAALGAVAGIAAALMTLASAPTAALVAALVAFGCVALLPRAWGRLAPLLLLVRQGYKCWAVSDRTLLLVDSRGAAVEIDLDRIVSLELDGAEPRIRIDDGDRQGIVYAALFDVFDEQGPSADAFFDALEPRLRRMASVSIVRHADLPLR